MESLAKSVVSFPAVTSAADPDGPSLLRAREVLKGSDVDFDGKTADEVTDIIVGLLLEKFPTEEVIGQARYLADEHHQFGSGGLLISRETGRAVGRISQADLYQPAPVPRGDRLVPRPARLRPDVEAYFLGKTSDTAREKRIEANALAHLKEKQTSLVTFLGDPRTLFMTAGGRDTLWGRAKVILIGDLPNVAGVRVEKTSDHGEYVSYARLSMSKVDLKGRNLDHDDLKGIVGPIQQQWGREIARQIALMGQGTVEKRPWTHWGDSANWIATPDVAWPMKRSGLPVLAVEGNFLPVYVSSGGTIQVAEQSYEFHSREIFDRWEVEATLRFNVIGVSMTAVEFTGMPEAVHVAS